MKPDWLNYDPKEGSLTVTNSNGKSCRYARTCQLQEPQNWNLEVNFAGDVVGFDEVPLRVLPKRIVVKRMPETNPMFGTPLRGAICAWFEFVRED
jgi:hypothetical protein